MGIRFFMNKKACMTWKMTGRCRIRENEVNGAKYKGMFRENESGGEYDGRE